MYLPPPEAARRELPEAWVARFSWVQAVLKGARTAVFIVLAIAYTVPPSYYDQRIAKALISAATLGVVRVGWNIFKTRDLPGNPLKGK